LPLVAGCASIQGTVDVKTASPLYFCQQDRTREKYKYPKDITWDGRDLNGNFAPDGEYVYSTEAWDGYGNEGKSPKGKVIIDNTPPSTTVSADYLLFSPNNDGRKDQLNIKTINASAEDT
jgi:hypothetical protein